MKKKVFLWIICIAIASVALATLISTRIRISEQEKLLKNLEAQKESLLAENDKLSHDLEQDITDDYIIRMMRKLGYYFPGEKTLTFTETPSDTEEDE